MSINTNNYADTIKEIWNDTEPYIRKLCRYKLDSMPEAIDDCMQDIYYDLCEYISNGGEVKNPRAWLSVVANNEIKDIYQKNNVRKKHTIPLDDCPEQIFSAEQKFSIEDITDEQISKAKDDILVKLSDDEVLLIKERYELNHSISYIAEMGCTTENNIYQRLYRLRKKVRSMIQIYFE